MKEEIVAAFSKACTFYDRKAYLQKKASETLLKMIDQQDIQPQSILEIGCGTGFITKGLLEKFPKSFFHITDISPKMVDFCKDKFPFSSAKVKFEVKDGENFLPSSKYDLIVSGLTMQWFEDFEKSFHQLKNCLNPDGIFIFSFLEKNSFSEWKQACANFQIPCTINLLPTIAQCHPLTFHKLENVTIDYGSARDFFLHLKAIGTHFSKSPQRLRPSQIKQLYSNMSGSATYSIAYGIYQQD